MCYHICTLEFNVKYMRSIIFLILIYLHMYLSITVGKFILSEDNFNVFRHRQKLVCFDTENGYPKTQWHQLFITCNFVHQQFNKSPAAWCYSAPEAKGLVVSTVEPSFQVWISSLNLCHSVFSLSSPLTKHGILASGILHVPVALSTLPCNDLCIISVLKQTRNGQCLLS